MGRAFRESIRHVRIEGPGRGQGIGADRKIEGAIVHEHPNGPGHGFATTRCSAGGATG